MFESGWQETLSAPTAGDHIVQAYQDKAFLCEAVARYVGAGFAAGEASVLIARPEHLADFEHALSASGVDTILARTQGRLVLLDAEETLAKFMVDGMPSWEAFFATVGRVMAGFQRRYPMVRAYGEMVDVLWQQGEREAALALEGFWNRLASQYDFALFCAYFVDPLDAGQYGGALECVCRAHTHVIPARDYARFDETVARASDEVLDRPLSQMLLSLAHEQAPATHMPLGQATLLWLHKNMPLTAEKVFAKARALR